MSDNLTTQDISSNQESFATGLSQTAGQMLKQARLDAGLHIAALAVSLRVPVKRIESLENGQMELLPDMVFVRALTSSICQALKIDAQPILDKLPKAALPRLNRDDIAINTPISTGGSASNNAWLISIVTSPLLLGVLFLCLAAVAVYFWPKSTVVASPPVATASKASADVGVSQAKEIQVANESVPASSLPASAVLNANVNTPATLNDAVVPKADTGVNTPLATENIVTFKASGETWVEVKSASGTSLFKKLLSAGETVGATGTLPLTVIVGRADVTQVEVRGKPVDLVSIAKSNVARFEVK
jgi:cytoskeleton protein RodZ